MLTSRSSVSMGSTKADSSKKHVHASVDMAPGVAQEVFRMAFTDSPPVASQPRHISGQRQHDQYDMNAEKCRGYPLTLNFCLMYRERVIHLFWTNCISKELEEEEVV